MLNFNQEVRAIETGCLSQDDNKEILVIGSPTQLLAYHVDNNRDLFFKEIIEGIRTIIIGTIAASDKPLVIVGGNREYQVDCRMQQQLRTVSRLKNTSADTTPTVMRHFGSSQTASSVA